MAITAQEKYRFENGKLFVYSRQHGCYIFVFSSVYATTKAAAIKAYLQRVGA